MRSRYLIPTALLLLMFSLPALASTYQVELGGGLSNDPDGSGTAILTIEGNAIGYTVTYEGIGTPVGAQIHAGAIDVVGDAVVDLTPSFGSTSASGFVEAPANVIQSIMDSPGGFYLEISTGEFPDGAIRGQLEQVASGYDSLTLVLEDVDTFPSQCPTNASGIVTLDFRADAIDYTFQLENVQNPTAAHIHTGTEVETGPILVDLNPHFTGGIATGSVPITAAMRAEILANRGRLYVNVHTADHPDGALRAQLGHMHVLPVVGRAVGQNNTNYVTDLVVANHGPRTRIQIDFFPSTLSGLDEPVASRSITLPESSQLVLNDVVGSFFNEATLGAMTIVSSGSIEAVARVSNDLRAQGLGTNGFFVEAEQLVNVEKKGLLTFLSHASATEIQAREGFRTNMGYFNPLDTPSELTLTIRSGSNGAAIGTTTILVGPYQHLQRSISQLFPDASAEALDSFYATWSSTQPMYVYAAVTDNFTGDAMLLQD